MKYCIACLTFKEESEFVWHNKKKLKLKPRCKPCNNVYEKSKPSYLTSDRMAKMKTANKIRMDDIVSKLIKYLLEHPCVDCGEKDIRCLDFDHLLNKDKAISSMVTANHSWERISEEIVKCEVRCANCHRKITHKRANTRKQQWFDKYQKEMLQSMNGMDTSEKQT